MRIGIDLDNTLINYSSIFYQTAYAQGLISKTINTSKQAVKQYFIAQNKEDTWTKLQGMVYGREVINAEIYPEAYAVLQQLSLHHQLFIISHKTQYPISGERLDCHQAAYQWLNRHQIHCIIPQQHIYFLPTLDKKVQAITQLHCDIFIDDLLAVLTHCYFPETCRKVWFNSEQQPLTTATMIEQISTWSHLHALL